MLRTDRSERKRTAKRPLNSTISGCSPAPLGKTVYCRIERRDHRAGRYTLYVENPAANARRFLMASQVPTRERASVCACVRA